MDKLLDNKSKAIEKLNQLLSEKVSKKCSSCGKKLSDDFQFNICEGCFSERRKSRGPRNTRNPGYRGKKSDKGQKNRSASGKSRSGGKSSNKSSGKKRPGKKSKSSAFKRG